MIEYGKPRNTKSQEVPYRPPRPMKLEEQARFRKPPPEIETREAAGDDNPRRTKWDTPDRPATTLEEDRHLGVGGDRNLQRDQATDITHGNRGGGPLHNVAQADSNGFMSAADKVILDDLAAAGVMTAAAILTAIKTVDGAGSGLDADLLDGNSSAAFQPADADLLTIAGLTATTDSFMQAKASAWAARTIAQVKTDLGLTGTNSGDQTSIVGITGTKAQFDTAATDGNHSWVGNALTADHTGGNWKVVYTNGSGVFTELALGASGDVLQSNGASSAPTFTAPSSGAELIATLTTTSGTTHSVTDIDPSYRELHIEMEGVSAGAAFTLKIAASGNNGTNYGVATGIGPAIAGAASLYGTARLTGIRLTGNQYGVYCFSAISRDDILSEDKGTVNIPKHATGGTNAVDAIQFSGGTFDAGEIRVYGVK